MPLEGCEDEHAEHRAFWDAIVSAFGESAAEEGLILVADSYFVEYAEQLADDLGLIPEAHSWPASYIDWEAAARDLRWTTPASSSRVHLLGAGVTDMNDNNPSGTRQVHQGATDFGAGPDRVGGSLLRAPRALRPRRRSERTRSAS